MRVIAAALTALTVLFSSGVGVVASVDPPPDPPGPPVPTGGSTGDRRDDGRPDIDVETTDDGFVITAGTPSGVIDYDVNNTRQPRPAVTCMWRSARTFGNDEVDLMRENPVSGEIEELMFRVCSDGRPNETRWVPTGVNVQDLIDGAVQQVRARLPVPQSDVNPDPQDGGWVNLGMWLAIVDPGVTTARASAGPVWAEGSGEVTGFVVDFGNGDVRECDDLGVRIEDVVPDLETFDEGPCGYTYRLSSPDDDPYQLTITSSYEVTFVTSSGRTGTAGTVERSVTVDYDVDEIQTVGRSN